MRKSFLKEAKSILEAIDASSVIIPPLYQETVTAHTEAFQAVI